MQLGDHCPGEVGDVCPGEGGAVVSDGVVAVVAGHGGLERACSQLTNEATVADKAT